MSRQTKGDGMRIQIEPDPDWPFPDLEKVTVKAKTRQGRVMEKKKVVLPEGIERDRRRRKIDRRKD